MLVCTSGHPMCKEWIFYPPCLLSQVSVSGGKGRSIWRSGRKHILAKSREGVDLHGETSLKESRSWAWLEGAVGEHIFFFTISWEREQALKQHRALALWVLVGSLRHHGATCSAWLLPAAVCAASVTRPRVPMLLLMAPFSPSNGEPAKAPVILHLHLEKPLVGFPWIVPGSPIPHEALSEATQIP